MPVEKKLLDDIATNALKEECLTLCDLELNDDDAIELASALQKNSSVTALILKGNSIGNRGVKALWS